MDYLEFQAFLGEQIKKKVIEGKSFEEYFVLDKIPLIWFYRKFFYPHIMPKPINVFRFIEKEKEPCMLARLEFRFNAFIFKKYLGYTENKKIQYLKARKRKKTEDNRGKVLLLTYSNHLLEENKIFRLENIIQKIRKDGKLKELVLFIDSLSQKNYKKIAAFDSLYQYYNKDIAKKARTFSLDLFRKWKGLNEKTKHALFTKKDVSFWPCLKPYFNFLFSKEFLYFLVLYYELFKRILREEKVKVAVITGTSSLFEKSLMAAAWQLKIPLIRVQHGISLNELGIQDSLGLVKHAVASPQVKKILVKAGVKKDDVEVVGPVVFDEINEYKGQKKKKGKNVLLITGPMIETSRLKKKEYFRRISRIIREINKIESVKISLKLHPFEKYFRDYLKMIKKENFKDVTVFKKNIDRNHYYKLMSECDLLVHFGSNAALEAMIIDRPVLTINLLNNPYFHHWLEGSKAALEVNYLGKIKEAVEKGLADEESFRQERKKVVEKHCGKVDGRASERVVGLIYRLAGFT